MFSLNGAVLVFVATVFLCCCHCRYHFLMTTLTMMMLVAFPPAEWREHGLNRNGQDPFRLFERISTSLDISLVPFFGLGGWPLGPTNRAGSPRIPTGGLERVFL